MVSSLLTNDSSRPSGEFKLEYQSGYPAFAQINVSKNSKNGSVAFLLPMLQKTAFNLIHQDLSGPAVFCAITVEITSENTATIAITPIHTSAPYTCSFSGDISTGTANVVIENSR